MNNLLDRADRLHAITQRVGFALWQLQELEAVAATYFVLATQAHQGMGLEAGNALEKEAKKKTFGNTIRRMKASGLLGEELGSRFENLLSERNWLVHNSRSDSRNAIHHDTVASRAISRIEWIAEEARLLLNEVGANVDIFVKGAGVSEQFIARTTEALLQEWHAEDAI